MESSIPLKHSVLSSNYPEQAPTNQIMLPSELETTSIPYKPYLDTAVVFRPCGDE